MEIFRASLGRRRLIGSAALAGGGLALPGCATSMARAPIASSAGCLPPVKVDASRVIRTVAGL